MENKEQIIKRDEILQEYLKLNDKRHYIEWLEDKIIELKQKQIDLINKLNMIM